MKNLHSCAIRALYFVPAITVVGCVSGDMPGEQASESSSSGHVPLTAAPEPSPERLPPVFTEGPAPEAAFEPPPPPAVESFFSRSAAYGKEGTGHGDDKLRDVFAELLDGATSTSKVRISGGLYWDCFWNGGFRNAEPYRGGDTEKPGTCEDQNGAKIYTTWAPMVLAKERGVDIAGITAWQSYNGALESGMQLQPNPVGLGGLGGAAGFRQVQGKQLDPFRNNGIPNDGPYGVNHAKFGLFSQVYFDGELRNNVVVISSVNFDGAQLMSWNDALVFYEVPVLYNELLAFWEDLHGAQTTLTDTSPGYTLPAGGETIEGETIGEGPVTAYTYPIVTGTDDPLLAKMNEVNCTDGGRVFINMALWRGDEPLGSSGEHLITGSGGGIVGRWVEDGCDVRVLIRHNIQGYPDSNNLGNVGLEVLDGFNELEEMTATGLTPSGDPVAGSFRVGWVHDGHDFESGSSGPLGRGGTGGVSNHSKYILIDARMDDGQSGTDRRKIVVAGSSNFIERRRWRSSQVTVVVEDDDTFTRYMNNWADQCRTTVDEFDCYDAATPWAIPSAGAGHDVDIGNDGTLWAIGTPTVGNNYKIYRRELDGSWNYRGGHAKRIAALDYDEAWVVTDNNKIYRKQGESGWSHIAGGLGYDVAVGGDGSVWVIGTPSATSGGHKVYKYDPVADAWKAASNDHGGIRIAVDDLGVPWIVSSDAKIYRWDGPTDPADLPAADGLWREVPSYPSSGAAADISIGGSGIDQAVWVVQNENSTVSNAELSEGQKLHRWVLGDVATGRGHWLLGTQTPGVNDPNDKQPRYSVEHGDKSDPILGIAVAAGPAGTAAFVKDADHGHEIWLRNPSSPYIEIQP